MHKTPPQTVCWIPLWSPSHEGCGLEQVSLSENTADSVLLAFDEDGKPFRLFYQLRWDDQGRLREANLQSRKQGRSATLALRSDGLGGWHDDRGQHLRHLDGCIDIDIWPTPLTNSFPLWRTPLLMHQRAEFVMAWIAAPDLMVRAQRQAYTRVGQRLFRFESLDGPGFSVDLAVDDHGLVVDYPGLFCRVP